MNKEENKTKLNKFTQSVKDFHLLPPAKQVKPNGELSDTPIKTSQNGSTSLTLTSMDSKAYQTEYHPKY